MNTRKEIWWQICYHMYFYSELQVVGILFQGPFKGQAA